MIEETLRVLEFQKILELLAGLTMSDPGREAVMNLQPLSSRGETAAALEEVAEMRGLLENRGRPPLGGSRELRPMLEELHAEGIRLSTGDLQEVLSSVETAIECRRFFAEPQTAPRLTARAGELAPLKELAREIRTCIGPRGEILDNASFELGDIRTEIRQVKNRIKGSLETLLSKESLAGVFQEKLITERSGRYVVPVRADHRGRIKGFVHDESASGQTLFVEPASVLKWNNRQQVLLREEKREEERILLRLSGIVREEGEGLLRNQGILAHLDARAASGQFAVLSDSAAPELTEEPLIDLREARHPLLLFRADGRPREFSAVPVDLLLPQRSSTLIISGPNTGGKTVAIKTIGLLLLMVRSGLHIPCRRDSRVHCFGRIFADIGDDQSIEENLSTFSGHVTRIRRILSEADGDSLVLLDEAGTGTDPSEGGALAMAVLDSLRERGARTVLTTHLNLIKGYAFLEEGVENAAVEFDPRTLEPTYRLQYGIPGSSNAFAITRRLGFPEEVLSRAESYLGRGEREGLEIIEELNRLRRELNQDRDEVRELRARAREEREKRKRLLDDLEERKSEILEKSIRRGEQFVQEAHRKAKALLNEALRTGETKEAARISGEFREMHKKLADSRPGPPRRGAVPRDVAIGEILRVTDLGVEGTVVRKMEEEVELDLQGKKMRLPLKRLEQFTPRRLARREKPRSGIYAHVQREDFSPVLRLVGLRVDEALARLDRFLDDALLHGMGEVEVVHGTGEGILRRAVREFLSRHRGVAGFRSGEPDQGGENLTIVELGGS